MPELMMLWMVARRNKPLEAKCRDEHTKIVGKCFKRISKAKEELWKIQTFHNAKI
jgi:hypothetical protein